LEIDCILQKIIEEANDNVKVKEVLFFKNGDYSLLVEDEMVGSRRSLK